MSRNTEDIRCTCTEHERCPIAQQLRAEFARFKLYLPLIRSESQTHRRQIVAAYTAHMRACGLLDGTPPDTEYWPIGAMR